jgi:predicted  nucleic acid-binding Zn-ribbon protein
VPDISAIVMLTLVAFVGAALGAGIMSLLLKNRAQSVLVAKEKELSALQAVETVSTQRQQELTAQNAGLQQQLTETQTENAALAGRMEEAQASFAGPGKTTARI